MLADRTGLTSGLSRVLTRGGFIPVHDRGRVMTDLAVAVACGARDIVNIEAIRAQRDLFGQVGLRHHRPVRALGEVGGGRAGRIATVAPPRGRTCGSSCPTAHRRSRSLGRSAWVRWWCCVSTPPW